MQHSSSLFHDGFDIFVSSVNIPWPTKGMTDADYLYAFHKVVMPIAMEFAPELVISRRTSLLLVRTII